MTLQETSSSSPGGRLPPDEATLQKIRDRAYQIWESNGRPSGRDAEHWKIAEEEILSRVELPDQEDTRPAPAAEQPAPPAEPSPGEPCLPPAAAAPTLDLGPSGEAEAGPGVAAQPVPGPRPAVGPGAVPEAEPEPGPVETLPAEAETRTVAMASGADRAAAAADQGAADQEDEATALLYGAMAPAAAPIEEKRTTDEAPVRVRYAGAKAAAASSAKPDGSAPIGIAPDREDRDALDRTGATVVPLQTPSEVSVLPLRTAAAGAAVPAADGGAAILSALVRTLGGAMQGGIVLAFGMSAFWLERMSWSCHVLERSAGAAGDLIRCRSTADLAAVESALAVETFEELLEESIQLFDLSARVARNALEAVRGVEGRA